MRSVVEKPTSIVAWATLLAFAATILAKPERGGIKKNLANIIIKRCKDFSWVTKEDLRTGQLGGGAGQTRPQGEKRGRKRKPESDKEDKRLARAVSMKLEEGNYKGAVRLISSEDSPESPSPSGILRLRDLHPGMPLDRGQVDQPGPTIATAIFSSELTLKAVKSFPPGSSGGPDGLSPLHLRDLISADGDEGPLLLALSSLTNLIISGGVPLGVRPFLFGGRLIALNKKGED